MSNFQVYRKVISFSFLMFAVNLLALIIMVGLTVGGFFIADAGGVALVGLLIGFILGIVAVVLINIFVVNRIKAAQIAMMVKGVTEGNLPEQTFKQGFIETKGRFGRITAFFFITNAIKGIFNQLGRGLNKIGTAVGGNTGNAVTSVIDSAVQTLIGYLCDCCLGWILFRKDQNVFKAGCEGAVIFFKHGKTLIRNIGRIFGMGFLSFLLIGGGFFGIFFLIFYQFPQMFQALSTEIINLGEDVPEFVHSITLLTAVSSAILGVMFWLIIHSVLIRPFILVGVMRNYMAAGQADMPQESDIAELANKSPRFAKLANKVE